MGCDIHCYIEYKPAESNDWSDFGGCINPGRNYDLFAKLAGIRNYDEITPIAKPRGYPEDAAGAARCDQWMYVTDSPGEGYCSPERAECWVENGASKYRDSEKKYVSNPDWHTHSWLTADEFAVAIEGSGEPEYEAILAAMRSFEAGGAQARIVFRATGITAYLSNGGTIEKAQAIAAHESPRTTKLYDRTNDKPTLDEIEKITI